MRCTGFGLRLLGSFPQYCGETCNPTKALFKVSASSCIGDGARFHWCCCFRPCVAFRFAFASSACEAFGLVTCYLCVCVCLVFALCVFVETRETDTVQRTSDHTGKEEMAPDAHEMAFDGQRIACDAHPSMHYDGDGGSLEAKI